MAVFLLFYLEPELLVNRPGFSLESSLPPFQSHNSKKKLACWCSGIYSECDDLQTETFMMGSNEF